MRASEVHVFGGSPQWLWWKDCISVTQITYGFGREFPSSRDGSGRCSVPHIHLRLNTSADTQLEEQKQREKLHQTDKQGSNHWNTLSKVWFLYYTSRTVKVSVNNYIITVRFMFKDTSLRMLTWGKEVISRSLSGWGLVLTFITSLSPPAWCTVTHIWSNASSSIHTHWLTHACEEMER